MVLVVKYGSLPMRRDSSGKSRPRSLRATATFIASATFVLGLIAVITVIGQRRAGERCMSADVLVR
eukprot:767502-Hanusia_phi.AAC.2